MSTSIDPRRAFLRTGATLSAVGLAMLAGRPALAQGMKADVAKDVDILNIALGLEHEAINAYQLGAGSGLLQKPVLDVAVQFQGEAINGLVNKVRRPYLLIVLQNQC